MYILQSNCILIIFWGFLYMLQWNLLRSLDSLSYLKWIFNSRLSHKGFFPVMAQRQTWNKLQLWRGYSAHQFSLKSKHLQLSYNLSRHPVWSLYRPVWPQSNEKKKKGWASLINSPPWQTEWPWRLICVMVRFDEPIQQSSTDVIKLKSCWKQGVDTLLLKWIEAKKVRA